MMPPDPLANAFRDNSRQPYSGVGENDDEFVASVASYGIGIANGRENYRRHLD